MLSAVGENRVSTVRFGSAVPLTLGAVGLLIFSEYFFLGIDSYVRLGDHQDSFLPRGISYAKSGTPGWMPQALFGLSSDFVAYRPFSFSNWIFHLVPNVWAPLVILAVCIPLGGVFLVKLLRRYSVSNSVVILSVAYFWIYLAREDLYWYVIALSFVPVVLWMLDTPGSQWASLIFGALAGAVFVVSNYLALTAPYLFTYILLHLLILGVYRTRGERRSLVVAGLGFISVVFVGMLPTYYALERHIRFSARTDSFYYDYGFLGSLDLVQHLSIVSLPAFLTLTGVGLWGLFRRLFDYRLGILYSLVFFLFFWAYVSQFYGFFGPFLSEVAGLEIGVPLQRFWLWLVPGTAVALPLLFARFDSRVRDLPQLNTSYPALGLAMMLVVVVAVVPPSLDTKRQHLEGWWNGSNLAWAQSPSWEKISSFQSDYRVAVVSSREFGLIPGQAQIAGFMTVGGDETASRFFRSFWARVDRSTTIVPNHTYYFGWTNEPDFHAKPINQILDLELLAKAGVRFVVSARPLPGEGLTLISGATNFGLEPVPFELSSAIGANRLGRELYIYEIPEAKQRIWFASVLEHNQEDFDLCTSIPDCVFVNDEIQSETKYPHSEAHVEPQPTRSGWEVTVTDHAGGVLVLNESWAPGWEATVDGSPSPVLRVNENFQGVILKPGQTNVQVTFSR